MKKEGGGQSNLIFRSRKNLENKKLVILYLNDLRNT